MTTTTSQIITLPDGRTAYVLTQQHLDVLIGLAEKELWWNGAQKRIGAMSKYASLGAVFLVGLSIWWPWIDRVVRAVLVGIPA